MVPWQKIIQRTQGRLTEAGEADDAKGKANALLNPLPSEVRGLFKKKEELPMPSLEDPNQTSRMLDLDRIAKNIQAGTDAATQTALQESDQTVAATQGRLSRVTGGSVGGTVDALLKSQRAGQQAQNQAIAQGQTRLPFFMNLAQQLATRAEQRKLELELLDRAQVSAETAQQAKEDAVNRNAAIASGQGSGEGGGQGQGIMSMVNQFKAFGGGEGASGGESGGGFGSMFGSMFGGGGGGDMSGAASAAGGAMGAMGGM